MSTTISGDTGITFPDDSTQSKAVSQATPFAVTASAIAGAELQLPEATANGVNYVALKAADTLAANTTFTLPAADGTNGQFLQTNGSGALAFASVPTTTPGGTSGQIQFNNAGAFGGVTAVGVANGGTGATTLAANNVLLGNGTSALQAVAPGTTGNLLTSNGTTWTSAAAPASGFGNVVVFTSSGTWSVPAGVTKCKVTVTGAGGGTNGRSGGSASGAAGGTAIKVLSLSGGSASITIGAGGTIGSDGGSSTFVYSAITVTGNGGAGTTAATLLGGSASGGDINNPGGDGQGTIDTSASNASGGASFWGGGGVGGSSFNGLFGQGKNGRAYGSGAGGCQLGLIAAGAPGIVVIEF
jgi:hypothetical protein